MNHDGTRLVYLITNEFESTLHYTDGREEIHSKKGESHIKYEGKESLFELFTEKNKRTYKSSVFEKVELDDKELVITEGDTITTYNLETC